MASLVQHSVGTGVRHKSNVIEIVGIERHAGWHSDASMLVVTTSTRLIIKKLARHIGEAYLSGILIFQFDETTAGASVA